MTRSKAHSRLALVLIVSMGAVHWSALSASAEPTAKWDQDRVTGIAKELADSVKKLYSEEYRAPHSLVGDRTAQHDFMDRLRLLEHETRHLASSLAKGADAHGTKGSVKRIRELNDDLVVDGRRMELVNPVLDQFSAIEDSIRQLLPYYGLERKS